jgi:hypothetical protein
LKIGGIRPALARYSVFSGCVQSKQTVSIQKRVQVTGPLGRGINVNPRVGLAQPYRLHFGNPEIYPVAYIFQPYRLHFGNPEISPTGFHFHHFYLIIAWNAKT